MVAAKLIFDRLMGRVKEAPTDENDPYASAQMIIDAKIWIEEQMRGLGNGD